METNELSNQLLLNLKEFIINNDIEISNIEELEINTRLIGTNSFFDSMDLVTFIVETEEFILNAYNFEIQLASEKALSRRTSPFLSISSLAKYIIELKNE